MLNGVLNDPKLQALVDRLTAQSVAQEVGVRATGGKRGARHVIWLATPR